MQSIDLKIPVGGSVIIPCFGSGVFFESGASSTANVYITIKPDTGAEIILKPGQSFKDDGARYSQFTIVALDNTALITGRLVIGNGDFFDSNGTVTLSGSLNTVMVNNTNAQAVPVQKQALSTITNIAGVTLAVAGTQQALSADATLKILRIRNTHATAKIAIGATGVTQANAAIILNPNDMWIEEEAAGASWFANSDTAGAIVALQGVK